MLFNSQVLSNLISVLGTLGVAFITYVWSKRKKDKPPKDRLDTIFDGYESLIKQQQTDIDRKQHQLEQTQAIIDQLQRELDNTRQIVTQQQKELAESKTINEQLIAQLAALKLQHSQA